MKTRKLDPSGDMVLGHGSSDFYQNSPDGVAQCVKTRLALWRGQWFIDIDEGTPWIQQILGHRSAVEAVLRERINQTPGVKAITSMETIFDPEERRMTVTVEIDTHFGQTTISETIE